MQTVTNFSGSITPATRTSKFDWSSIVPGQIYKAEQGTDYTTHKGFLVSMSRYANELSLKVERFVADDGSSVEFRFVDPTPVDDSAPVDSNA